MTRPDRDLLNRRMLTVGLTHPARQLNAAHRLGDQPKRRRGRTAVSLTSAPHWEGDLLLAKGMSGTATLVERSSRFAMLVKLERINSETVAAAPNGLLRQYFPKRVADFRDYDQTQLDGIAAELNGRPRKTLQFMTPSEKLNEAVALIR